jgi:hypothetical protein
MFGSPFSAMRRKRRLTDTFFLELRFLAVSHAFPAPPWLLPDALWRLIVSYEGTDPLFSWPPLLLGLS